MSMDKKYFVTYLTALRQRSAMTSKGDYYYIDQVVAGNTAAYAPLVERYQNMVYSIVIRIVHKQHVAEEVSQDVFVKVYQALPGFQKKAQFSTWLYRIAYNAAISYVRKHKLELSPIDDNVMNNFPDDDVQDNVMGLNADEQKKLISQALGTLNELDRVLVELFYLYEKSVEEITNITGLTNSNVKVKLHRIRKRLYGEMDKILKNEMVGI